MFEMAVLLGTSEVPRVLIRKEAGEGKGFSLYCDAAHCGELIVTYDEHGDFVTGTLQYQQSEGKHFHNRCYRGG
jgi:hypothetical protein